MSPYLHGKSCFHGFQVCHLSPRLTPWWLMPGPCRLPVMGQHRTGLSQAAALPSFCQRQRRHQSFTLQKASFCGFWIDPSPLLAPNWLWRRWSTEGSHLGALQSKALKSGKLGEEGAGPLQRNLLSVWKQCAYAQRVLSKEYLFRRLVWLAECDLTGFSPPFFWVFGSPSAVPNGPQKSYLTYHVRYDMKYKKYRQEIQLVLSITTTQKYPI